MKVNFNASKQEFELIKAIVNRACNEYPEDIEDRTSLMMDITAVHVNDTPIRLNDLLEADKFNFAHDVFGIRRHIDRKTGKLTDCFLPRFCR